MIYKNKKPLTLGGITLTASRLELVKARSKLHSIARRGTYGTLAVMMVLLNMTFINVLFVNDRASAATAILVPDGDVTTGWSVLGGANDSTCAGGTHCDYVDEGTPASTSDFVSTGEDLNANATEEFSTTTVGDVDTATSITVYFHLRNAIINGGTADNVQISIRIGGTLQTVSTVTPTTSWAWYSATFNGAWTQADIDSLQLYANRVVQGGGGPPTGHDDDTQMASAYADVTYTRSYSAEQSAYQWFENQDAPDTTWAQTWGGINNDYAYASAIDDVGNIYLAGYTDSTGLTAGTFDQTLVKYDNNGIEQWSKTWGGTGNDVAYALDFDATGNIYVVGYSDSTGITSGSADQTLVKYDNNGIEQWSKTWGSTGNDIANAVTIDTSGNIYVAGFTDSTSLAVGLSDQTLVKYDNNGIEQWSKTWGDTGTDRATSVSFDANGNIYVAGYSNSTGLTAGGIDQTLVKYDSNGIEQWSKTWGDTGNDYAEDVALDSTGNIYVAGRTDSTNLSVGSFDQTLVKYDSSGIEQWSKTWGGDGIDYTYALTLDATGNIYTAGRTDSTGLTAGGVDQTLVKYDSSGIEQWSKTWGGDGTDIARNVTLDSANNIYVTGYTDSTGLNVGAIDQSSLKFDSTGTIADCAACVDRTIAEVDRTIAEVDRVISEVDRTIAEVDRVRTEVDRKTPRTVVRCGTIKGYMNTWGGATSDLGQATRGDSLGNTVVTGYATSYGAGLDDLSLTKFDNTGTEVWTKTWGTTAFDYGLSVDVDASNNYIVSGYTTTGGNEDALLVKFNSDGVVQWSKRWGAGGADIAYGVTADSNGDYIMTGSTTSYTAGVQDLFITKFDTNGNEIWSSTWGAGSGDYGLAIDVDSTNNYIVTGFTGSYGNGNQVALVKFNTNGVEQWSKTWGGTGDERGYGVAVDSNDEIIVSGAATSFTGNGDSAVIKFDSTGTVLWTRSWGLAAAEVAYGVNVDSSNNIIVGSASGSYGAGGIDAIVSKISPSGTQLWSKTWGGTGDDRYRSIYEDANGDYIAAGHTASYGAGSDELLVIRIDSGGFSCGGVCNPADIPFTNRDLTETTQTITEVDRTVTVTNVAVTEVDQNITIQRTSDSLITYDASVGAQLNSVSQNTATTAPAEGTPFRLRITAHITVAEARSGSFKLQYAVRSGTCDTGFAGEIFSDVTTSSGIAIYEANRYPDGASLISNVNDPLHSLDTNLLQEYDANGTFNIVNSTAIGQDALWDIPLVDNGAAGYESFCFRIVSSAGSPLSTYTVIPEITVGGPLIEQSAYRWFENSDSVPAVSTWAQTWGGTGSDIANAVQQTSDGGYITAGETVSFGAGQSDQFLVKYNSSGVEQWSKTWGGTGFDYAHDVQQTSDGGYITAGSTTSVGAGNDDQTLVKYNSNGIEQWSKTWGGTGVDYTYAVQQTSDGGYITAGSTTSFGAGNPDQTLVKYDSNGIEQWSKTWGGTGFDIANAVQQTTDGGYITAGSTDSFGAGLDDQTLVKYDASGIEQWSKTWGGTGVDVAYAIQQTSDGGFITTGTTFSYGAGDGDQTLIKYDNNGIEQWSKTWGGTGTEFVRAVQQTSDGGFITTGQTTSYGAGSYDQTLVKYDSNGIEQWSKTWGGTGSDIARAVQQTSDGGYIVAGETASYGAGSSDQSLVKFDGNGDIANCAACQTQTITEANQTITEANQTITEGNVTITEANQTITEADQNVPTLVHCGVLSSFASATGGTGADKARTVAEDSLGNIYVAGETTSYGAGGIDVMVVKYDSSGIEQWTRTWGGTGAEIAYGIAVDNSGDIVVTGHSGSFGSNRVFLYKLNSSGTEIWSRSWGGGVNDYANAIVVDSNNDYIVVGETETFGTADDAFITKFNSSGAELWSKTVGGANQDLARSVVVDATNNIYITGESTTWSVGLSDMFISKLDSTGVEQWTKYWGGSSGNDKGYDMALDSQGNIGVIGYAVSTGFTQAGGADFFLAVFNSAGIEQWSVAWGGAANDFANAVAVDANDTWYVTGEAESLGFGTEAGSITAINSSGTELWTESWSGPGSDLGRDIIFANDGDIIMVGEYDSFGAGLDEFFLLKRDPAEGFCGGICKVEDVTVGTITTTETDVTVTEVDRAVTEGVLSATIAAQTEVELVVNETTVAFGGSMTALAGNNTVYTLPRGDEPLRLRLLLNTTASPKTAAAGTSIYKLQIAPRIGTCDASFIGENYVDISSSSIVSFYDNPSLADGLSVGSISNDPSFSSLRNIPQTYEEANNFTNSSSFGQSEGYIWDFALTPNDGLNGTYCIRTVNSDGSLISGYNQIVELELPSGSKQQMRHGAFFDAETEGTKQAFYW